jgi:hypothetical protein
MTCTIFRKSFSVLLIEYHGVQTVEPQIIRVVCPEGET